MSALPIRRGALLACALLATGLLSTARANDEGAAANGDEPPFDFNDAHYLKNGINPAALLGRPNGTLPNSTIGFTTDPTRNDVRILQTNPTFDNSGHVFFWVSGGVFTEAAFTKDAAGQKARQIADSFALFAFPSKTAPPGSVFPKRQEDVAQMNNGYFSNDPLGLWLIASARFTPKATDTVAGKKALADLAQKNGLDLDGTPVVKTLSEIDDLVDAGYLAITTAPADGSQGPRWLVCPVIKDPRGDVIAPDAFTDVVTTASGAPLPASQPFLDAFHCLQSTGDFCDPAQKATSAVRLGQPANPAALAAPAAPILGTTWQPHVAHATFVPSAAADLLLISAAKQNVALGAPGTLLVSPSLVLTAAPGASFPLPIPLATGLIGFAFSAQGASAIANGTVKLTNALDVKVGTY